MERGNKSGTKNFHTIVAVKMMPPSSQWLSVMAILGAEWPCRLPEAQAQLPSLLENELNLIRDHIPTEAQVYILAKQAMSCLSIRLGSMSCQWHWCFQSTPSDCLVMTIFLLQCHKMYIIKKYIHSRQQYTGAQPHT